MAKETYLSCEMNGQKGADRIAAMYSPGGEYYRPGMTVTIEHGMIPSWGSALPGPDFGRTEPGYRIIVNDPNR